MRLSFGWLGRPGHEVERVAVDEEQAPVAPRIAELSGALHHRVEHGLKVRRGPAHHREHLGERGFARPRFGEISLQVQCSAQTAPLPSAAILVTASRTRK